MPAQSTSLADTVNMISEKGKKTRPKSEEMSVMLWIVIFCGGLRDVPNVSLVVDSNCGSIAHGVWVLKDCWLCRCAYGTLHCLSETLHSNCGKTLH